MSLSDNLDNFSLYVHFPWCIRKCPYCDFNSHESRGEIDEHRYIESLIRDFDHSIAEFKQRSITSIFLGGGTPSLFSGKSLGRLIKHVTEGVNCEDDLEVTLEANPGALEHDQFARYLDAGINRLSLGVQSFDDGCLTRIGRIHDSNAARMALDNARKSGFRNINIDMMFGLPDQSLELAIRDCENAIACDPEHVSCYQLTLEPNTWFYVHPPALPDHDLLYLMQTELQALFEDHGFMQYEVSAYAKHGKQCKHNLHYWTFGDYLGIGAGAHSKILAEDGVLRIWNEKHPRNYQDKVTNGTSWKNHQPVNRDDLLVEFMMNALRIRKGISLDLFERRTLLSRGELLTHAQAFCDEGLLLLENDQMQCTEQGYLFIDEIIERMIS
ncbi:MAG: radical SAM family heme chaperone HemW [Gammaproteobacteria bacterium]|nr:radical SAM family heme chaperone HemW [Gammaproteobacteria bacterium]